MIHYTMMPQELIFPPENMEESKQLLVNYEGIPLMVEMSDGYNATVIRVLSTDPNAYLDNRITPGTKISFAGLNGLSAFNG